MAGFLLSLVAGNVRAGKKDAGMDYFLVFLGAGIGGALRHGANIIIPRVLPSDVPVATLSINVLGSFVMGVMAEYFALRGGLPQHARLFLTTGILGGFTTFSTFSLEAILLYERGQFGSAALYMLASVTLSLLGLALGLALVRISVA
jgi:CrcB protein